MKNSKTFEYLEKASLLKIPDREKTLMRDPSVSQFWIENKDLLEKAWTEWEVSQNINENLTSHSLIDSQLLISVKEAWKNPETEKNVNDLLQEVCPGVYKFQFFNPLKIEKLRSYLQKAEEASIPVRPPYGIVLNRKGAMLDKRSEGYLAAPSFQSLYQEILDKFMRPISRLVFPEIFGYDTQTFGFSIEYKPEKDTSIRMHTDASSVTLNLNLNLPNELYTGSEVDFYDSTSNGIKRVSFQPGEAMLHRGNVAHAAQPIRSGQRTNLVLWLYGDQMQIPRNVIPGINLSPKDRWSVPNSKYDTDAPF